MSASFCAKNGQAYSPAGLSTACGSPLDFKPTHRVQRSMTAERGFRNMGNIESSFFYERAPKEENLRESVQSPYLEGKKNNNFVNPTFYSSSFLTQSMEMQRSKTPDVRSTRQSNNAITSQNVAAGKCLTTQTPREAIHPIQIAEAPVVSHLDEIRTTDTVVETRPQHSRKRSVVEQGPVRTNEANDEQRQLQPSRSEAWLNVCSGCHNYNLADEKTNNRRKEREAERQLERAVLERNYELLQSDQERERAKKDLVIETSNRNFDRLSQKGNRNSSTEGRNNGEYNVEIKLNSPSVSAESLKCLERYQSMMDKMYDASVRKTEQRRAELNSGHSHNRNAISRNESNKTEEKKSATHVKWNLGNEKSLLDKMNEQAAEDQGYRNFEKRRASEYNSKTGSEQKEARRRSPLDVPDSPFKVSSAGFEKSSEGKSVLDKMYQSSLDYWKKQKQNLNSNSQMNKSTSALRRSRVTIKDDFDGEYVSPIGRDPASAYRSENKASFMDKINVNDQQSAGLRSTRTRDCSSHNKSQTFLEENAKLKTNLEAYYTSPTKKVGQTYEIESAGWTENGKGVFHKIDKSSALLNENRKQQLSATGSRNRQQIIDNAEKKIDQQVRDKNFKEQALIVCAHKSNVMCCGLCNRKVPANKISKVVGDYNKLIKNRQQRISK